jgi:hypothetical protein
MLDLKKSSDSTTVVLNVIRELTCDTTYANFKGIVTANVNGTKIIDKEEFDVHLTNSRPNYALIDIMWEECGYKAYKKLGLYGRMSTQYQVVKKGKGQSFKITSDEYEIDVEY